MLQIPLTPDAEKALEQRAAAIGQDVASYVAKIIQDALRSPSADELLAPYRKQVEDSGISDAELDRLGEDLREEAWKLHLDRNTKSG